MNEGKSGGGKSSAKDARRERQARALRENLSRRKAQARARAAPAPAPSERGENDRDDG